jgi:phage gp36-like protein
MNVTGVSTLRGDITLTGSQAGVTSIFYDASANTLQFNDNTKAIFGDGSDMAIFHDGNHSLIDDTGTGSLILRSDTSVKVLKRTGDENMVVANPDGSVELYCDNTKQFETAYGGVVVTGIHSVGTGATISGTGNAAFAGVCTASAFKGDGSNLTGIAAGGSGEFNTSISGATQYDVTTSMATALTANASASHRTIVHSIHICNISAAEASISGEIQSSFSIAHNIPVPAGSAVELLKQPKVLGPSETIELQSDTASALEATIIIEYKEDTDFWDAQVDLTSAATLTDIYVSTTNPSVVQSILLANDDGTNDVKARVAWTDGSNNIQSYLCYDMVIPAESTVELCEKPKYLAADYKLRGYANQADRLEITASGKQITS